MTYLKPDHIHRYGKALMGTYGICIKAACLVLLSTLSLQAQRKPLHTDSTILQLSKTAPGNITQQLPDRDTRTHDNGKLWFTVYNSAEHFFNKYPRHFGSTYGGYVTLWIGGIVGSDTLVSTAVDYDFLVMPEYALPRYELWPDPVRGRFKDRSETYDFNYTTGTYKSVSVFETSVVDTLIDDFTLNSYSNHDQRYHLPIGLRILQTSYSWGSTFGEDFVIVDYQIQNIGDNYLREAFIAFEHEGQVRNRLDPFGSIDDNEGYLDSVPHQNPDLGWEQIQAGWIADRNGKPAGDTWDLFSVPHTAAIAPIYLPDSATCRSFNWLHWHEEGYWGPRRAPTPDSPLRLFNGQMGWPYNDREKYYLMSHAEYDYSSYAAAADNTLWGWMPRPPYALDIADGHYSDYILSYGPFELPPQSSKHVVMVYTIGEYIHARPSAYAQYFDFENPWPFINQLDFDDLVKNIRWAKRIYDNPGVDTDNDGDSGKFYFQYDPVTQENIRVYYEGDGVPDFRGPEPPPSPPIRILTVNSEVTIRWNGYEVEGFLDKFTNIRDFEGYRVYISRSEHESDIMVLASFDREDYNRHIWNPKRRRYEVTELPFTLDSLRNLYGSAFEPLDYSRARPLELDDNFYYFTQVDYNVSELHDPSGIHKVYPDATPDSSDVDSEGRRRFYEYEYVISNLLPTVPYYVAVTAFDFGDPSRSLEPLESSPFQNLQKVYAITTTDYTDPQNKLNVYVYPNPYRVDGGYTADGFENRLTDIPPEKARSIYFANLPAECTISIYSLDGDLIRRLEHDSRPGAGDAAVQRWDLINRNRQAVESGLYYWVVESAFGTQIGKLVIIK